jgi:cell wall-associated NlpC family hydrolase
VSPKPFPIPGGPGPAEAAAPAERTPATPAAAGGVDGYALTGTALALRGTPYRNGGVDPRTGFDCSGFTQYVFGQHGLSLPRAVRDQFQTGKKVEPDELDVGDLIFFTTVAPGPTHVGIVIGSDQFIHAPSSTGVVRIERLSSSYWAQRFLAARRVL